MKGIAVFEALTDIRGEYILDAEVDARFLTTPVREREKSPSSFSRFMNSGLGVAIICALVAVSVMGGIIWAGLNAGYVPPGHSDAVTGEVYLTAGAQTVTPEAFFASSEESKGNQTSISCGSGFYGQFTVSPIPTLTGTDRLQLHMPDHYVLNAVLVYDPEDPTNARYTFESMEDLETLKPDTYYIALRITHTEGQNKYCYDYAFCLDIILPLMKKPYAWPVFDPPAKDFLGEATGNYPEGGSVANIALTAAYTRVKMPEGMAWYVMTARYAKGAGDGGPIFLLYDPQSDPTAPYVAADKQLQFIYPPVRTMLQLEDGRIITLHGERYVPNDCESLEITANVWMWSKVDPHTGETLETIQLCPVGEAWTYTFDLSDSLKASGDWQYAFAAYIYGLTGGNSPTLRVLLDNLFCETDDIQGDLARYEHFSEEETLTAGWDRLQRIMNGWLRPDLWMPPKELNLHFGDAALGTHWNYFFKPDGTMLYAHTSASTYISVYTGTYKIANGEITVNCPDVQLFLAGNLNGTHTFQLVTSAGGYPVLFIDDIWCAVSSLRAEVEYPSLCVYIPGILEILSRYNKTPEKYTVVDMDGDGAKEIVVQTSNPGYAFSEAYVFFVDPLDGKIVDHLSIQYSYLYEDGSFGYTFDRTGPSYGVDKLVFTGKDYQAKTLWRIYNDGAENAEYYIGEEKVTWEELQTYVKKIECGEVFWMDCFWTHIFEGQYKEETEDGKGAATVSPGGK